MNNDDKTANQNVKTQALQADQAGQSQSQPVVPTGSLNKEIELKSVDQSAQKFIEPSEKEPKIDPELKEIGIETKKDVPDIDNEDKKIINHAKQFAPVSTSPSDKVEMPMSEEEIASKLKTGQNDDSVRWLVQLINKVMAVMALKKE